MSPLAPGTRYRYQVGSAANMSDVMSFPTPPADPSDAINIVLWADMGIQVRLLST